jgi:hypothetical protein
MEWGEMMGIQITMQDFFFFFFLAFVLTVVIVYVWEKKLKKFRRPKLTNYNIKDMDKILQRCYRLFPTDIIQFQGETFHRGMKVHITTDQNKYFEGQLIGLSRQNMICVITNRYIIAQDFGKIEKMYECVEEKVEVTTP